MYYWYRIAFLTNASIDGFTSETTVEKFCEVDAKTTGNLLVQNALKAGYVFKPWLSKKETNWLLFLNWFLGNDWNFDVFFSFSFFLAIQALEIN